MAKEPLLQFEGVVMEVLPEARYRIRLTDDHVIIACTAERLKKNRVGALTGDRVTVEVSSGDRDTGFLIFRHVNATARPHHRKHRFIRRHA